MKTLKTCGRIAIYPLMALLLFYQVMGIIGVTISTVEALVEATWLVPVWIVMIVLIALPLILYPWWKKKEILPLVMMGMSLVGAVLALVIALTLQAALPLVVALLKLSRAAILDTTSTRLGQDLSTRRPSNGLRPLASSEICLPPDFELPASKFFKRRMVKLFGNC